MKRARIYSRRLGRMFAVAWESYLSAFARPI
jgi:hypothetical protein